jgi:hypothetical protein
LNKYQRVMEHVKVDDDMRKRILQNVENELSKESKVVQFGRGTISQIRKHAGMAAMFAILLLGAFAVARITGGITHTSAPTERHRHGGSCTGRRSNGGGCCGSSH